MYGSIFVSTYCNSKVETCVHLSNVTIKTLVKYKKKKRKKNEIRTKLNKVVKSDHVKCNDNIKLNEMEINKDT